MPKEVKEEVKEENVAPETTPNNEEQKQEEPKKDDERKYISVRDILITQKVKSEVQLVKTFHKAMSDIDTDLWVKLNTPNYPELMALHAFTVKTKNKEGEEIEDRRAEAAFFKAKISDKDGGFSFKKEELASLREILNKTVKSYVLVYNPKLLKAYLVSSVAFFYKEALKDGKIDGDNLTFNINNIVEDYAVEMR